MEKKYSVGWGLTNTCNMNCKFCYSKVTRDEISECGIADWKNFVDRNHNYIEAINYGTGENSVIDDFFYFVEYVRKKYPEIKQALTTNGFISERVRKNPHFMEIYKNCIDEVDISIDFNNQEKHCLFRGQPKAFDWAIDALKINKKLGKLSTIVFVGFNETMTKENLDGLFELAKKYDALIRTNIYRPVNPDQEKNKEFILSYDQLKNGLKYINENYEIISLSDSLLGNAFSNQEGIRDNTGTSSIRILPDGTICPSTYLIRAEDRSNLNIHDADLKKLTFEQFSNIEIPKECQKCEIVNSCQGGAYDRRILWYGTFAERDPYCPIRNGDEIPKEKFQVSKINRVSVHDGYLPTLFFKNRESCDKYQNMEHVDYERELKYLIKLDDIEVTLEKLIAILKEHNWQIEDAPKIRYKNETYYDTDKATILKNNDVLRHSVFDDDIIAFTWKKSMTKDYEPWVSKMEIGSGKYYTVDDFVKKISDLTLEQIPKPILTAKMERKCVFLTRGSDKVFLTVDLVDYEKDGKIITEKMIEIEDEYNKEDKHLYELHDILINSGLPIEPTKCSKYERGRIIHEKINT